MNNRQRIWYADEAVNCYRLIRIIASVLSLPYCLIIECRNWLYDHEILPSVKLSCPVISVGNITVGGTGKTPCVIMLAKILQKNGFQPAVLSRGYGGKSVKSINTVSDGRKILLESKTSGDEALLIAQSLDGVPVITGSRRIITGKAAIDRFGANVLICDDAFQHRKIFRDIDVVLLDSQNLPENDYILPRGRLREPLAGLKRASAFVLTRTDEAPQTQGTIGKLAQTANIPIFTSIHKPKDIINVDGSRQWPISELRGKKIYAFCGIAKPESFKNTLLAAGARILLFDIFSDHHRYSKRQLRQIRKRFIESRADFLITTQKDAVRMQGFPELLDIIKILRIEMEITPSIEIFESFILNELSAGQKNDNSRTALLTIKTLIILFRHIPLGLRRLFSFLLSEFGYRLSLKHRLIALHNLQRSFPEKPREEIVKIARKSYRNFSFVAAEFFDIPYLNKKNLHRWISIEGLDNYRQAYSEGKGVLLFGAHFGNWEIGNAALAIMTQPFIFVYRIFDSHFLERGITYVRSSYGNVSLSKENTMRRMIRLLKEGAAINLLIDQNVAWYGGVFVDFFGRKACTTSGLALLAAHTKAPVLPAFTRRLPNGKYLLEIGKRVEIITSGNREADISINTQNFTKIIEEQIRKYPEQWFWVHQRWKTKLCQAKQKG